MKPELILLILLLLGAILAGGCVSGMQISPYANATPGKAFYDLDRLASWKYAVAMNASGTTSAWNMTVNSTGGEPRHMVVATQGNGMDIVYDIWWNGTTRQIERMHAKGAQGDYYQDRDVSPLQIFTLPDTGLTYYYVPLQPAGNVTMMTPDGRSIVAGAYTAADASGFRVTYWVHPAVPLPLKIEMSSRDFKITMMLLDCQTTT